MVSNCRMLNRVHSDLLSAWRGVLAGRWSSMVAAVVLAIGTGASITAATVAYRRLASAAAISGRRSAGHADASPRRDVGEVRHEAQRLRPVAGAAV